jgi:glutaconate CoA-transferase, subunit A
MMRGEKTPGEKTAGAFTREQFTMGKVVTMQEAVAKYVKSGNLVFIGGMQHGEPFAAVHEILRQGIDHLQMVGCLVTSLSLLIGEGRIDKVFTGYYGQDVNRSYLLSRAKEMGKYPEFVEYSHFGIAQALMAGQMGIGFIPIRSQSGSDMLKFNPNITVIDDPFTGEKTGAVKAIVPDVGILHVQRCDAEGNAQRWGTLGVDAEGINASRTVIITTEKIVSSDIIHRDPNLTIIPGYRVAAVVEQPWGAHPLHLAGHYSGDWPGLLAELGSEDGYTNYMQKCVYGVKDWNEFLEKRKAMKGAAYFDRLKIQTVPSEPVLHGNKEAAK